MGNKALVIVDVQNDFVEGGALGVDGGNAVADKVAAFVKEHKDDFAVIVTTRDWHIDPGTHFDTWPVHCVAETEGAAIHKAVVEAVTGVPQWQVVSKGMYSDGYSGFEGVQLQTQYALDVILADNAIEEVVVVGIATDHCVRATALDGSNHTRFTTVVFTDMIAGVTPETSEAALQEMRENGVTLTTSKEWLA